MRLQGKVAIITGAGSGIGRESALLFTHEGARVVVADIDAIAGESTVKVIQSLGHDARFIHVDVSKSTSVKNLVAQTEQIFGKLNIMFNNAGIFPDADGSVVDTSEEV